MSASSSATAIVLEQSDPLTVFEISPGLIKRFLRWNQLVLQPLLVSFGMTMANGLINRMPEHLGSEADHSIETFFL